MPENPNSLTSRTEQIFLICCRARGCDPIDLRADVFHTSYPRNPLAYRIRDDIAWALKQLYDYTLHDIAGALGRPAHSSIHYALERGKARALAGDQLAAAFLGLTCPHCGKAIGDEPITPRKEGE